MLYSMIRMLSDNCSTIIILPSAQVTLKDVGWPGIRYAEVLFNYMMAAKETDRSDESLEVLKAISHRAGIEPGADIMYESESGRTRKKKRQAIR